MQRLYASEVVHGGMGVTSLMTQRRLRNPVEQEELHLHTRRNAAALVSEPAFGAKSRFQALKHTAGSWSVRDPLHTLRRKGTIRERTGPEARFENDPQSWRGLEAHSATFLERQDLSRAYLSFRRSVTPKKGIDSRPGQKVVL